MPQNDILACLNILCFGCYSTSWMVQIMINCSVMSFASYSRLVLLICNIFVHRALYTWLLTCRFYWFPFYSFLGLLNALWSWWYQFFLWTVKYHTTCYFPNVPLLFITVEGDISWLIFYFFSKLILLCKYWEYTVFLIFYYDHLCQWDNRCCSARWSFSGLFYSCFCALPLWFYNAQSHLT